MTHTLILAAFAALGGASLRLLLVRRRAARRLLQLEPGRVVIAANLVATRRRVR